MPLLTAEEKQGVVKAKAKAEAAKAAIAEARAKVAARGTGSGVMGSTVSTATSLNAGVPEAVAPKVKKASRVVALIKMKKTAQVLYSRLRYGPRGTRVAVCCCLLRSDFFVFCTS